MFDNLLLQIFLFFLQLPVAFLLSSFLYNFFLKIFKQRKPRSASMSEMLKEDKAISFIVLIEGIILLSVTIIINLIFKPLIGFYFVSFFSLAMGSSFFFPPKGRKISENCYVMRYHIDDFIVTLNDHKIWIQGNRLMGKPSQIIYREQAPKWLPPYEREPLSEKDYEYALEAIIKFLKKIRKQGKIEILPMAHLHYKQFLRFIDKQDGIAERKLKEELFHIFRKFSSISRAYLARIIYNKAANVSDITLCLAASREERELIVQITEIFKRQFNKSAHMDIIFLKGSEEEDLKKVCKPFYDIAEQI